jgi:hypothetical protein
MHVKVAPAKVYICRENFMRTKSIEVVGCAFSQAQRILLVRSLGRTAVARAFKRVKRLPYLACLVLAGVTLAGCTTTGYQKGDVAAQSLKDAAGQVRAENQALDLTMVTLRDLVNKSPDENPPDAKRLNQPAIDLKPAYQRFSRALDRLEAAAARTDQAATKFAQKNAAYLANWNKELNTMSYEAVRTRSAARKNEVSQRFEAVNRRYSEARAVTQPLISYLNDIRKALGTDLTTGGLASVKPIVQNAEENTVKVQAALGRLTDELSASSMQMASIMTVTPEKSTTQALNK